MSVNRKMNRDCAAFCIPAVTAICATWKLSLKAKGLLSLILSLPEDWNYTTRGIACICRDGVDSISSALKELEQHGYLIRRRVRFENGRLGDVEYTIYEKPISREREADLPKRVNPEQEKSK